MKIKKNILIVYAIILCSFIAIGCNKGENDNETKAENSYILEVTNGERFFKSEVIPELDSEKAILDFLKIDISDDYDELANVLIDSERFNHYPETYKNQFDSGLYTEELTVHSLKVLSENEYSNIDNGLKYYAYMDNLEKYNPSDFEIIEVNYTNKLTDEYNKIAQWGSGNWTRYFVVVKENKDSGWRIFDIYGHM